METSFDPFFETEVPHHELIISRTDLKGNITYVNDVFAHISGYSAEELIGKPHNVIRHRDMPKSVFKNLWETLQAGKNWSGYVKNLRKDKGYYWVYAEVSGVYKNGELVEYKSIREPMAHDKKVEMQHLYDHLRFREEHQSRVVIYVDNELLEKIPPLES